MSQPRRQLRLVFSSSNKNLKIETLPSARSKKSRAASSMSLLQKNIGYLEQRKPAVAKLIGQLVDDALAEDDHRLLPARLWPAPIE